MTVLQVALWCVGVSFVLPWVVYTCVKMAVLAYRRGMAEPMNGLNRRRNRNGEGS